MASIFHPDRSGEIQYKVAETEDFLPSRHQSAGTEGHTLAIPKAEVDYFRPR